MAKSKFKPTVEESFAVGENAGAKAAFEEILELINEGAKLESIKVYAKSRVKSLISSAVRNPLKTKGN